MTVTFQDGTSLPLLGVHGRPVNYEGVQRDSLLFLMDPERVPIQAAMEAFTPENCQAVTLAAEDGAHPEAFVHENYTIRVEVGQGSRDYALSGSVSEPEQVPAVYVRMARSTLAERTMLSQQEVLDCLLAAALEGEVGQYV